MQYALMNDYPGIPDKQALSRALYGLCVQRICRSYVPILPHFSTNGIFLSAGLNAYFRHFDLPLHAHWGVSQDKLWPEITRMLRQDLPVILGIGKSVKHLRDSKLLNLYREINGTFEIERQVSGHFLTVLGQNDEWLHVSSWGRHYAIKRWDLLRYTKTESTQFLCNIL